MWTLRLPPSLVEEELRFAELQMRAELGLMEEPDVLVAFFRSRADAESCCEHLQAGEVASVPEQDWSPEWQKHWRASPVGRLWYLAPPWDASPTPPDRHRLVMRPGNVFGSGDHPTTRLCLALLEDEPIPERPVLDVGTGTGLLALAATQMGMAHIAVCDIDVAAVREASHALVGTQAGLWLGSTDACRSQVCALVLVNLPGGLLIDLVPELRRILQPGGRIILSGFLREQAEALRCALRDADLSVVRELDEAGWGALSAVLLESERPRGLS